MKTFEQIVLNNRMKMAIGILIILAFGIGNSLKAQSSEGSPEPTLKESLDFITGKVNASGCSYNLKDVNAGHAFYWNYDQPRTLEFDNGAGSFTQELKDTVVAGMTDGSTRKKDSVWITKYKFNLAEMSQSNIKLIDLKSLIEQPARPQIKYAGPCYPVEIHTYNDEMKILKESSNARDRETATNIIRFYFKDEETAKRVAKAFAQAIKLSGAKKEVF